MFAVFEKIRSIWYDVQLQRRGRPTPVYSGLSVLSCYARKIGEIVRCGLIYIIVQPVGEKEMAMAAPVEERTLRHVIVGEVVLGHSRFRPFFTSRKYSFAMVSRSYSRWPVTKNCRPSSLAMRCTPAAFDAERISSSGCLTISSGALRCCGCAAQRTRRRSLVPAGEWEPAAYGGRHPRASVRADISVFQNDGTGPPAHPSRYAWWNKRGTGSSPSRWKAPANSQPLQTAYSQQAHR